MFDYINYKNTIPVNKFLIESIPSINPNSKKFVAYWKSEKRKCIEGNWVEHKGKWKWAPGTLHFHVNHWHILRNEKGSKSKTKSVGKPMLRDLEWIKHYVYSTARGFSGFFGDRKYSSHRVLSITDEIQRWVEVDLLDDYIKHTLYNDYGQLKEYKDALPYLYDYYDECLGKPIYYNQALNVVDLESRGTGKSYTMSVLVAHNFLFDGAMDYDEYLSKRNSSKPLSSETVVSAIDTKYSADLISKVKLGLDYLEGGIKVGGKQYPAPLYKQFVGTWHPGNNPIVQSYSEKVGGKWEVKGTKSKIHHRGVKDNPFAINGTRPGLCVIDEVGFCNILEELLGQLAECTADGADKFGTIWMTGTGGDMDGGSTLAVKKVFYDPKANNCLEFDDIFENTGKKIGFFIPAWMGLNQFKDELGNTDRVRAIKFLTMEREKKMQAKSKHVINNELQQRPIIPSEVFLLSGGNIFFRPELSEHIKFLETTQDGYAKGRYGTLSQNGNGVVTFIEDFSNKLRPCEYPMEEKDEKEGCVVIWEEPIENPPYSYYISSLDPYAKDTGTSLGSFGVFAREMAEGSWHDKLVAEYTARPSTMDEFMDTCRKLILYYKAPCLYESNFGEVWKAYMQNRNLLPMLFKTPTILKNNKADAVANTYGLRMTGTAMGGLKSDLEEATKQWLYQPIGDGKLNLHNINSVPLLRELENYNDQGNFDRVIMLMLFVAQKMQLHKVKAKPVEERTRKWIFTRKINGVIQ